MTAPYAGYMDQLMADIDRRAAQTPPLASRHAGAPAEVAKDIEAAVRRCIDQVIALSHDIHAHPELGFQEHHAIRSIARCLASAHIDVEVGSFGLQTALRARAGSGAGPRLAIIAEYDALPEIGHACGHNIICAAAVGAFLGLATSGHGLPGVVELMGTPAEEGGGGKQLILDAGGFDGVDAAMMVHPMTADLAEHPMLGMHDVRVTYHGVAAHAAGMPFLGRNALDAVVTAYQGIAQLRQHMLPTDRVHGVITDGGQKANVVPARAAAEFFLRSARPQTLRELSERVDDIFVAAARSTGTEATIDWAPIRYLPVRHNRTLVLQFAKRLHSQTGRRLLPAGVYPSEISGSTDMGNVSHQVPSIHPFLAIAPPDVAPHSPGFAQFAASPSGDAAVLDGAIGLALTAADVLWDTSLAQAIAAEFTGQPSTSSYG